ncbi:hypothetical protein BHM03_00050840 [Ensete ventricosum]|nr:hypothetical protein BHM03_00050840 [Ensete ventricosum]
MPAEEHDDAAADDVKPRLLLPQRPAEPAPLRHLPVAPHHLHAGQRYLSLQLFRRMWLQFGEFPWRSLKAFYGGGEAGGGATPEARMAGACAAARSLARVRAPSRPYRVHFERGRER